MQKLGDKLADAGIVERPKKTTFADGTMATTEAYLYYKERCQDRGMDVISKMMFKWHLKHGQYLQAGMAPNPFGRFPARIYAISKDAVKEFVVELAERETNLTLQRQGKNGNAVRRTTKDKVKASPPLSPESDDLLMNSTEAFKYLCKKATHKGSALNKTLFGFYLAYELIDSVFVGRSRQVEKSSLDAFLELCPTGLYKKHIDYVVKPALEDDDLTMTEAYAYYKTLDAAPVAMNSFRSLTAAGVIVAIRAENKPSSKTLGFTKSEIVFFARMRARIAKKNADVPTTKGFKTKVENGTQRPRRKVTQTDTDSLDSGLQGTQAQGEALVATQAAAIKKRKEETAEEPVGEREWVSIREAYHYYCERVDQPHGEKWFAGKCYKNDPIESRCDVDKRPSNPSGKKYMVNLDSVDVYLQSKPETKPSQKSYPLDKAYHKFRDVMSAGLSLIQFKRLVRNNILKSFVRDGVARVRQADVAAYFQGQEEIDKSRNILLAAGYDYYCSKCSDPVAKAHFLRWVYEGVIEGTKVEKTWHITMSSIDDFLTVYPSGRTRTNKNSRVASGALEPKDVSSPEATETKPTESEATGPLVTLSMSKFPTKEGLAAAVQALADQGIRVHIEP